jgi:hypothetical protein
VDTGREIDVIGVGVDGAGHPAFSDRLKHVGGEAALNWREVLLL